MFSWLIGSSEERVEPYTDNVNDVMLEAHIVKDFYNRMMQMCIKKCNATSLDQDDLLGKDNCMDRCLVKFDETKKIVEKELEKKVSDNE